MCGIAGFSGFTCDFTEQEEKNIAVLNSMGSSIKHRGPDDSNIYLTNNAAFSHMRLSIIDLKDGKQPMFSTCKNYTIIYNGELYNTKELKIVLQNKGYKFETNSDTEVILASYMIFGIESPKYLNGIFSYAIWDNTKKRLFLCRDRAGVKPLYYTITDNLLVFASELKSIFKYPNIKPILDKNGLCEIFGLFPSRTEGNGVFKNINEINFGCYAIFDKNGFKEEKYWELKSTENNMSYAEVVEQTKYLVTDSCLRQMASDVPISTLLSGGIDSSIITAVIANEFKKQGMQLDTYSFDYKDNAKHFISNSFQADTDEKWVVKMIDIFKTNHKFLECDIEPLLSNLYDAVDAKDYPGMADIDSSLLYFCGEIKKNHKVALSGECADEIFGGYPWFHDENAFKNSSFPWIRNMDFRKMLLSKDLLNTINIDEYIQEKYDETILTVPKLEGENSIEVRRREISYLNYKWFMATLLERTDRMSMYKGLELRVPYADHRIMELLWNIPWHMKCKTAPKSLLRDAFKDLLPEELINRKKSPYPKTYNPNYENLLKKEFMLILQDKTSPILTLIDIDNILEFMKMPSDYGKPWFGQLMAAPQLIAFYIQINYWLKKYNIEIKL